MHCCRIDLIIQRNANAPGARLFYDGCITGAHFRKTDTTIQVTGTLNADAAQIIKDGGGFYDFDGKAIISHVLS